ncbi:MAG TPA: hypothetical protein VFD70_28490 [Anaerolineae bacterium]|nr:hypothetical protein [Anaerolineae bacterium]
MDLKKFIKDAKQEAARGGDVNVANVGEGARVEQLGIGRNIFQAKINIGSLVIPVRFLLALLAVAAVVAGVVWWIVTPGQMPPGNANIAIVEFGEQDATGNLKSSSQGAYLSQWLYNRLNESVGDLPEKSRPSFWHLATGFDLTHFFQKRVVSAPIRDDADAERIARQFNARIVIYGNLAPGQSAASFIPQFYIESSRGEADELTGSQQLGQPIPITANVNDEYLEQTLQPIGRALIWFSRGLNNDLNGRYDLAYQVLKQGEGQLTDWNKNQGKEVLYYFIGREALFLANCEDDARIVFTPQGNTRATDLALKEAEDNFKTAQQIAADNGRTYARATFGLGQVQAQRAQRKLIPPGSSTVGQCRINVPPPNTPISCPVRAVPPTDADTLKDADDLNNQAIGLFNQAQKEMPVPAPSRLEGKLHGALAFAEIFKGELLLLEQNTNEAEALIQGVASDLQQLTQTAPADDRRTLAETYLGLGTANLLAGFAHLNQNDQADARASFQNAIQAFSTCNKMIPSDEIDTFLRANILPNCSCTLQDAQKALDGLK